MYPDRGGDGGGAYRPDRWLRDFWFKDVPPGVFTLRIEADGFVAATVESVDARQAVNLGDTPLAKEVR